MGTAAWGQGLRSQRVSGSLGAGAASRASEPGGGVRGPEVAQTLPTLREWLGQEPGLRILVNTLWDQLDPKAAVPNFQP